MLVACDTVLLCTAAIGEVPWHVDAKLVCPVYGAAGDFISDSLSNRPDCAFDVSGQRVIDVGFVGEYDFNLCAVGKRLRNHHEGLRIGSKGFVRGSRSGFIQCLREIGGSIYTAPAMCSIVQNPLGTDIFQTDALYGTSLHVIPAHEPDGCQGMVESKRRGIISVFQSTCRSSINRICKKKVFLVGDVCRDRVGDCRASCLRLVRKDDSFPVVGRVGEESYASRESRPMIGGGPARCFRDLDIVHVIRPVRGLAPRFIKRSSQHSDRFVESRRFYGRGTGKDGRVRTNVRRGGSDTVGVKRVQVKGSIAISAVQGLHGIPWDRLFCRAARRPRAMPLRPLGYRKADIGSRVRARLNLIPARGEQDDRKQYRQAQVSEPPA